MPSATSTVTSMVATSTNQVIEWKTYTDPDVGFSFQYPLTWPAPIREILGSHFSVSTAKLYIEDRTNYNNTSGKIDTFDQIVSSNFTNDQVISKTKKEPSPLIKKITLDGRNAAEITGNNLDDIYVNLNSTSTLIISNDNGSIDPNTFASIISSFIFDSSMAIQTETLKSSDPFMHGGGAYSFEEFAAPDEGWEYVLKLTSADGRMRGELIINGFQTQTDIDTTESYNNDGSYNVYFSSNNDGTKSNLFVEKDLLFTFIPITSNGLSIKWFKLQPMLKTDLDNSVFKLVEWAY